METLVDVESAGPVLVGCNGDLSSERKFVIGGGDMDNLGAWGLVAPVLLGNDFTRLAYVFGSLLVTVLFVT